MLSFSALNRWQCVYSVQLSPLLASLKYKQQKETLLVGEVVNYTPLLGTLKSASSSKIVYWCFPICENIHK